MRWETKHSEIGAWVAVLNILIFILIIGIMHHCNTISVFIVLYEALMIQI